ncbi:MAG: sigma-70 family RNA polymerase sigma factor [Planctomycetia bacterium]|nr:sigma-70 family RNA polymerase sigma factor [Planctomycetia bacterium]
MTTQASEIERLLAQIRQGSEAAAREFVAQFGPHLLRIVRRSLHRRLRSKFDSDDFVQSVWASFFADLSHVERSVSPEELVAYLAALARNKTVDEFRRRVATKKLSRRREKPLASSTTTAQAAHRRHPTASGLAVAQETWDRLNEGEGDVGQEVLQLRLAGATFEEIAERLGVSARTARRIVQRSQQRLGTEPIKE